MPPFHLVANWKAHKTLSEATSWFRAVGPRLTHGDRVTVCPAFPLIIPLIELARGEEWHVGIGAQTVSFHTEGPYTGEVPAALLAGWVEFALVGHSERRMLFAEDEERLTQQLVALEKFHIPPLLFTSEVEEVVGLAEYLPAGSIVAFEKAEAISTSKVKGTPASQFLAQGSTFAREVAHRMTHAPPVYYGGSVQPATVDEVLAVRAFAGAVVGQASMAPDAFLEIVDAVRSF